MATIDKLEYINNTKNLIKNALNTKFNSQIGDGDTFRSYAQKIDDIYENWPKVSEENTNFTLNSTKEGKMKIELKGNTSQDTTIGKNKYEGSQDFSGTWNNSRQWTTDSNTYNGLVVKKRTSSWNGINKDLNVESGKFYTFSVYIKSDTTRQVALYTSGGTSGISVQQNINTTTNWARYSLTFEATASGTIRPRVENTSTSDSNYTYICGYQFEENSSATSYEPYTNGPSPNPDYPQDIHVVSGDNSVNVCGKNLYGTAIKTDSITGSSYTIITDTSDKLEIQGISSFYSGIYKKYQLQSNTQYTISLKYSELGSKSRARIYYKLGNDCENIAVNDNNGYIDIGTTKTSLTFTTDSIGLVAIMFMCNFDTNLGYVVYNDIQLEKGNQVTTYEAYEGASYPINLGTLELCKINDFQDYLYKQSNTWFKKPIILKINNYNEETITTDYMSTTGSLTPGATVYYINPNSNPNGIEITDTILINQLNILEQVTSYNSQTNIWQINDNLPFIIAANALLKNSN